VELLLKPGYALYEDTWIKYEADKYDLVITFLSSFNKAADPCPLSVRTDSLSILANSSVYKDADMEETCSKPLDNTVAQYYAVGVQVDMYKHGTKERVDIPDIYQVLKDVDMGQAYICLNEPYEASELFIKNKLTFDKNLQENSRYDYITENGDIFSDFSTDPAEVLDNPGTADVFRNTEKITEDGLDLVFGFTRSEEAGLSFYVPHHKITFNAGKGGTVSRTQATARYGDYLEKGSIAKADPGYKLKEWITDQPVIVEDIKLKKGDAISMAQIESIVVTDDLSFTAVFEKNKTKH